MEFNPDECEMMHFGGSNLGMNYTVNGRALGKINIEGSGHAGPQFPKVATQVAKVIKKAYGMLAFS